MTLPDGFFDNQRDWTFKQAIRATAGLLYWFTNELNFSLWHRPIISTFTQTPSVVYNHQTGTIYCNLQYPVTNAHYEWTILDEIGGITKKEPEHNTDNYVWIKYNTTSENIFSNLQDVVKNKENNGPTGFRLQCHVWKEFVGGDTKEFFVRINSGSPPHGCPFVYTWSGDTWIEDNNILPQSQDSINLGNNVTDYYQLFQNPVINNEKYSLAVGEFEEEISYLDQLKLLVVDHSVDTYITIDDSGNIIQFTNPAFFADARIDSQDVYRELLEMDQIQTSVGPEDTLNAVFEDSAPSSERWLLLIGQAPAAKNKVSGQLTNENQQTLSFSTFRFRRNSTYQWIAVPDSTSNILQLDISWNTDAEIDYSQLAHVSECPFEVHIPELLYAEHTNRGDVTEALRLIDDDYIELNTDEIIYLDYEVPQVNENLVRTFIFVSNGRYENNLSELKSNITKNQLHKSSNNLAFDYELGQNYPNPFNPNTTINYTLKEPGLVELEVYSLLGQKISTLVHEFKKEGLYTVNFDASNLPSGFYFYYLRVNDFYKCRKMILIK